MNHALSIFRSIAVIVFLTISYSLAAQQWQQKGLDLNGESAADFYGYSVSMSADGNTIAVGTPWNDQVISGGGHVRVFFWNGLAWQQKGSDIDATAAEALGVSVSLSDDGNTLAIGAPIYNNPNAGSNAGRVLIYQWNGAAWVLKGLDIRGIAASSDFGWSVDLNSDGNTIAIGAPLHDANGPDVGETSVYDWNGTNWLQRGTTIAGLDSFDYTGWSVSISADGSTLATSAEFDDGNGIDAGSVRVYEWTGVVWQSLGAELQGEAAGDQFGCSISLSADGLTLCVGASQNTNANGATAGHTRVFAWNGTAWLQKGVDIDGEASPDRSGYSTCISADGNTVAIGAINSSNVNSAYAGQVRVYSWNGSAWIQKGADVDGEAGNNVFGYAVGMSADGNTFMSGAIGNDDAGNDAGSAYVYTCQGLNFIQQDQCGGTYTSPTGNHIWSASGVYFDTLASVMGCDSIIMINLAIHSIPGVTYTELQSPACLDWTPFALTPGSPVIGGAYSGVGVSGNVFDPVIAGLGSHDVIYTVTDSNGCIASDTSIMVVDLCSGILTPDVQEISVTVSPNPGSGLFTLQTNTQEYQVLICDAFGRRVLEFSAVTTTTLFDLSGFADGVYYIVVQDEFSTVMRKVVLYQ